MSNRRAINIFGSKVMNAHRYPSPRYERIVEPFAGGAGYSLLHHHHDVVLFDSRPEVVNVWRYLILAEPYEIARLPLLKPGQLVSELECSDGGKLLISWCCNQLPKPAKRLSSWGAYHLKRGAACYWGPARRKQAADVAARVKHWGVELADYTEASGIGASTWFIDPTYQESPKLYGTGQLNYGSLADWCRNRPGQVIVCERAGADWLPFRALYESPTSRRQKGGQRRTCREAVWVNG